MSLERENNIASHKWLQLLWENSWSMTRVLTLLLVELKTVGDAFFSFLVLSSLSNLRTTVVCFHSLIITLRGTGLERGASVVTSAHPLMSKSDWIPWCFLF